MNNPHCRFIDMGRPMDLNRRNIAEFKPLVGGEPVSAADAFVNGTFSESLPMLENGVYMLT